MTTLFFYFNKAYALLFLMINYIPHSTVKKFKKLKQILYFKIIKIEYKIMLNFGQRNWVVLVLRFFCDTFIFI